MLLGNHIDPFPGNGDLRPNVFRYPEHTAHLGNRRALQEDMPPCPQDAHKVSSRHNPVCRDAVANAVKLMTALDDQHRAANPFYHSPRLPQEFAQSHNLRLFGGILQNGHSFCHNCCQDHIFGSAYAGSGKADHSPFQVLRPGSKRTFFLINSHPHPPKGVQVDIYGAFPDHTAAGIIHGSFPYPAQHGPQQGNGRAHPLNILPCHSILGYIPGVNGHGTVCMPYLAPNAFQKLLHMMYI